MYSILSNFGLIHSGVTTTGAKVVHVLGLIKFQIVRHSFGNQFRRVKTSFIDGNQLICVDCSCWIAPAGNIICLKNSTSDQKQFPILRFSTQCSSFGAMNALEAPIYINGLKVSGNFCISSLAYQLYVE